MTKTAKITGMAALAMSAFAILPAVAQEKPDIAHGKALVEANCARCHAVGPEGESPLEGAPPFRTLSERYPISSLEEAFAEGIVTGHPSMPEFEASPTQIADIVGYIESIQQK